MYPICSRRVGGVGLVTHMYTSKGAHTHTQSGEFDMYYTYMSRTGITEHIRTYSRAQGIDWDLWEPTEDHESPALGAGSSKSGASQRRGDWVAGVSIQSPWLDYCTCISPRLGLRVEIMHRL